MAEEETNSRITDLKARLEGDPGSRVFYQLGEELRKSKRLDEAETVLRQGLEAHSGYLSAWISLGRVLKEMSRPDEAIEVLNRAFELDRQNVVVARLLGEAYADTGEHVEAIKKYKLVAALHPADEEIQERIQQIEVILRSEGTFEPGIRPAPLSSGEPVAGAVPPTESDLSSPESDEGVSPGSFQPAEEPVEPAPREAPTSEPVESPLTATDDWEPDQSPLEESDSSQDLHTAETEESALPVLEPDLREIDRGTAPRETGEWEESEWPAADEEPDTGASEPDAESTDDVVATITMGDLYARQGHVEQARSIYRRILDREPGHEEASNRLESLHGEDGERGGPIDSSARKARVRRLENWLSKVRG